MANKKISALTTQTTPDVADLLLTIDVSDTSMSAQGTDKKMTIATLTTLIMQSIYPVGSYYGNGAVSTNPATLFGFGTWLAVAGKTIVGLDAGQTEFDTLLKTGGENKHTLTSGESGLPAHNHPEQVNSGGGSSGGYISPTGSNANSNTPTTTNMPVTGNNAAANAVSAHNNLQPYEVAALWRRTV